MTTHDIAKQFTQLCGSGKFEEAGKRFWSDKVVSIEPMTGEMARLEGRQAVENKGKWWAENNTVHNVKVEGPFINGDTFMVRFEMDVTPKGKERTHMTETALYTVKNDKIVEEKFFARSN